MNKYPTTILFVVILSICNLNGQDLHYSQFFNSPLNLSPGLTGVFDGEQRFHGNYKQQWKTVPVDYRSYDLGVDFNFKKPGKKEYFSLGALINYDQAGDLSLSLVGINVSGSYTLNLGENSYLTPGIGLSFASRSHDNGKAFTGNQWDGRTYDPSIPAEFIGSESLTYFDVNAGLNYRWYKSFRTFIDFGVGVYHLTAPSDRFKPNANYTSKRPQLYSFYGMFNLYLTKDIDLILNGLASIQDSYREVVLNLQGKIYLNNFKTTALYLGGGMRFDDAWYPMFAISINNIYVGLSYDFNISDFDIATDGKGGPEFSVRYIIAALPTIYKPCLIY